MWPRNQKKKKRKGRRKREEGKKGRKKKIPAVFFSFSDPILMTKAWDLTPSCFRHVCHAWPNWRSLPFPLRLPARDPPGRQLEAIICLQKPLLRPRFPEFPEHHKVCLHPPPQFFFAGAKAIAQQVWHLPCTQSTQVGSPAFHRVPELIRSDFLVQSKQTNKQKKNYCRWEDRVILQVGRQDDFACGETLGAVMKPLSS